MRTQRIALILICLVAGVAPVSAPDAAEIDLFAWDACQHEWRVDVATQATVAGVSVHWQPDMAVVRPWLVQVAALSDVREADRLVIGSDTLEVIHVAMSSWEAVRRVLCSEVE